MALTCLRRFLTTTAAILGTANSVLADPFNWFEPVSGSFSNPDQWLAPEGSVTPLHRDPNPNRRLPGPGDTVSFTRANFGIGSAYDVFVSNDASVAALSATGDGVLPGLLQPLTFLVTGKLTAQRLALSGDVVLAGGGEIVGTGVENSLLNTKVTSATTLQLNVLSESSSVTVEGKSFLRANRLVNLLGGLKVAGESSVLVDSALINGGTELRPSILTEQSTFEAGRFEMLQGWLAVSAAARLHTGSALLSSPQGTAAFILVTGSGSEWICTNTVEDASLRVLDQGVVHLGDVFGLGARVVGAGSKLKMELSFATRNVQAVEGASITADSLVFFNGNGLSQYEGSSIKLTGDLSLGIGGSSLFEIADGGLLDCHAATLAAGEGGNVTMNVSGAASVWRIHDSLVLGKVAPAKASLTISEGANVTVGPELFASKETVDIAGDSTVLVTGANAVFNTRFVTETVIGSGIDLDRGPANVRIFRGGAFGARRLVLGPDRAGEGILTVDGADSRLDVQRSLVVGGFSAKGTLTIRNGAKATASVLELGKSVRNSTVLVSTNSTLSVSDAITVGSGGQGTLTINGQGKLSGGNGTGSGLADVTLGFGRDSTGTLVVDGAKSLAELDGRHLVVGGPSGSGDLTISAGGQIDVMHCTLGYGRSSVATAKVMGRAGSDAFSTLRVEESLVVGGSVEPVAASLQVSDWGHVIAGEVLRITSKGQVGLSSDGRITIGVGFAPPGTCLVASSGRLIHYGNLTGGPILVQQGGLEVRLPPPAGPQPLNEEGLSGAEYALASLPQNTQDIATIEGQLSMEATAVTTVEIAGPQTSPSQVALKVTGPVKLGGKLIVRFTNGFAPVAGEVFQLFDFASGVSGQFAQTEVTGLAPGFQFDLVPGNSGQHTLTAMNAGVSLSSPPLYVQRAGPNLIITWPDYVKGFTIESTAALGTTAWQPRATTSNRLEIPLGPGNEFFRLYRP